MSLLKSIKQQLGLGPAAENMSLVRQLLNYDPETGVFIWAVHRNTNKVLGQVVGFVNSKGYRVIKIGEKAYKAHRIAFLWMTGQFPLDQVDHINGDKSDNRWCNLREASNGENQRNVSRRGVSLHHGKWRVSIQVDGERITVGRYDSEVEAMAAYASAKRLHHVEYVGGVQ